MTEQLISDLKAARAELAVRGRCRGRQLDDDGRVCVLGAIGIATLDEVDAYGTREQRLVNGRFEPFFYGPRQMRARNALESVLPEDGPIFLWNDKSETTDEDVLNLFDKALAELGGLG